MARFDTTKAFQGAANIGAQGAFIGNMLKKKYGGKAVGIGAGVGAGVGFLAGGLQGTPDPELGARAYKGVYDSVRADTMRQARQASRAVSQQVQQYLRDRGIGSSDAAVGIQAANQGRIFGQATAQLIPLETQMRLRSAEDRLHAQRVGEFERRQGFADSLTALGVTGINAARAIMDEHEMDELTKKTDAKKVLPENFMQMDALSQSSFLAGRGIRVPAGWETMTPEQRLAFIQGSGLIFKQGPVAAQVPAQESAQGRQASTPPEGYMSIGMKPPGTPAESPATTPGSSPGITYGPEERARQEAEIARRRQPGPSSAQVHPKVTPPTNTHIVDPKYIRPDGTVDQQAQFNDMEQEWISNERKVLREIHRKYGGPDGTLDYDRMMKDAQDKWNKAERNMGPQVAPTLLSARRQSDAYEKHKGTRPKDAPAPDIEGARPGEGGTVRTSPETGRKWGKWLYDNDKAYWDDQYEEDKKKGFIPRNLTKDEYMRQRGSEMASAQMLLNWRAIINDPEGAIAKGWVKPDGKGGHSGRINSFNAPWGAYPNHRQSSTREPQWAKDLRSKQQAEIEKRKQAVPALREKYKHRKYLTREEYRGIMDALSGTGETIRGAGFAINENGGWAREDSSNSHVGGNLRDPRTGKMRPMRNEAEYWMSISSSWAVHTDANLEEWRARHQKDVDDGKIEQGFLDAEYAELKKHREAIRKARQRQGISDTNPAGQGVDAFRTDLPQRTAGSSPKPQPGFDGAVAPPVPQERIHKLPAPPVEPTSPRNPGGPITVTPGDRVDHPVTPKQGGVIPRVEGPDTSNPTMPGGGIRPQWEPRTIPLDPNAPRVEYPPDTPSVNSTEPAEPPPPVTPTDAIEGGETTSAAPTINPLVGEFQKFLGMSETSDTQFLMDFMKGQGFKYFGQDLDPSKTPWCAAFLSCVLKASGFNSPMTARARDFAKYGTEGTGEPGDIAVWENHVGIVTDEGKILGANQGNKVSILDKSVLDKNSKFIGYRKPSRGGAQQPAVVSQPAQQQQRGNPPAMEQSMEFRNQLDQDTQKHLEAESKTPTTPAELTQWSRVTPMAIEAVFQNPQSGLARALLNAHTGHVMASMFAQMGDQAAAEAIAVYNSV